MLGRIFGWTSGATIGTLFTIAKRGRPVGEDEFGNKYYESKDNISYDGRKRRWVVYNGYADASRVPPGWRGWLCHAVDVPPSEESYTPREWQKPHVENMTGTADAYVDFGALDDGAVTHEHPRRVETYGTTEQRQSRNCGGDENDATYDEGTEH